MRRIRQTDYLCGKEIIQIYFFTIVIMIFLIITTSINNKAGIIDADGRRNRYIDSIRSSLQAIEHIPNIKPIIVENSGISSSYLDELQCDVVYTDNNKIECTHKGVNELYDIHHVIKKYNIRDNDIIIKLTGRYKVLSDSLFTTIVDNADNYDAFIKFFNVCTLQYMHNDCVLGLLALRCKLLKEFSYKCDKSPECEIANLVRSRVAADRVMEIADLHLECCFADDLRKLIV